MLYFIETLNEVLEDKGLSRAEFSRLININSGTIYNLKKYNPTIQNALLIVDYFSSSFDYFEKKTDKFNCSFNKDYTISFYKNMRVIKKEQNITKVKLCKDLGISHSSLDRWASGTLPTYANLISIADYLDVSIDKLLGRLWE